VSGLATAEDAARLRANPVSRRLVAAQLVLLAALGQRAPADTAAGAAGTAVPLSNGANALDILGDGTPGQVFVAWRGNYNAHGFRTIAFHVLAKSDLGRDRVLWQNVPFFGGPNDGPAGREAHRTREGADCVLGDLRVVRPTQGPIEVVVADREMGRSFADTAPVRFYYYRLARNTDADAGRPPYYFELFRTVPAKRPYCDVNEAFQQELALGTDGAGRAETGKR